jgi:ABC-type thiamine transport system substrate-binding protein
MEKEKITPIKYVATVLQERSTAQPQQQNFLSFLLGEENQHAIPQRFWRRPAQVDSEFN